MIDPGEEVRGNISLPPRLQSPDLLDPNYTYREDKVEPIMNMQKAFYDILISDHEKCIERLEARNDELMEEYGNAETLMNSVDVETGDEIAHLNRLISVESEKVESTKQRIDELVKLREEERQAHLRKINLSNDKYENTRVALTSSIKTLNAKINTLEDYKQSRGALLEKLRIHDETLAQNEKDIAQERDAINRKFKIDREKLKNEMYSRLLALAGTFQLEISDTIALPVHRLMRENIFIKSELLQIVDETLVRKEDYARMRNMEVTHHYSIKTGIDERKKHLITAKIQRCLLKGLEKMHSSMKKRLEHLEMPREFAQEIYDDLAESVKAELAMFGTRTRKLEVLLHRESIKLGRAKYLKSQTDFRAKIYEEILYDVKYAVACALKITETGQDILEMSETELISHLLNLFTRGETKIHEFLTAASNVSVPRPSDVYVKGDLGFEPEHIDLEESTVRQELAEVKIAETIIPEISARSGVSLPAKSLEIFELERARTRSKISVEESSEISNETTPMETKESSDYQEDISESPDSVIHENEESLSVESEGQEEA